MVKQKGENATIQPWTQEFISRRTSDQQNGRRAELVIYLAMYIYSRQPYFGLYRCLVVQLLLVGRSCPLDAKSS